MNDELAAFSRLTFSGRFDLAGDGDVTITLRDDGLEVLGAFGELFIPYEAIARSMLMKDSLGAIRLMAHGIRLVIDIPALEDRIALFAQLEERIASDHQNRRPR